MVLGGVYSSSLFSYYKINVQKCVDDLTIDKICKTDAEVAAQLSYLQGSFRFQLYQSNNIINQDQMQPKTSYLSDVTQFLFSPGEVQIKVIHSFLSSNTQPFISTNLIYLIDCKITSMFILILVVYNVKSLLLVVHDGCGYEYLRRENNRNRNRSVFLIE